MAAIQKQKDGKAYWLLVDADGVKQWLKTSELIEKFKVPGLKQATLSCRLMRLVKDLGQGKQGRFKTVFECATKSTCRSGKSTGRRPKEAVIIDDFVILWPAGSLAHTAL